MAELDFSKPPETPADVDSTPPVAVEIDLSSPPPSPDELDFTQPPATEQAPPPPELPGDRFTAGGVKFMEYIAGAITGSGAEKRIQEAVAAEMAENAVSGLTEEQRMASLQVAEARARAKELDLAESAKRTAVATQSLIASTPLKEVVGALSFSGEASGAALSYLHGAALKGKAESLRKKGTEQDRAKGLYERGDKFQRRSLEWLNAAALMYGGDRPPVFASDITDDIIDRNMNDGKLKDFVKGSVGFIANVSTDLTSYVSGFGILNKGQMIKNLGGKKVFNQLVDQVNVMQTGMRLNKVTNEEIRAGFRALDILERAKNESRSAVTFGIPFMPKTDVGFISMAGKPEIAKTFKEASENLVQHITDHEQYFYIAERLNRDTGKGLSYVHDLVYTDMRGKSPYAIPYNTIKDEMVNATRSNTADHAITIQRAIEEARKSGLSYEETAALSSQVLGGYGKGLDASGIPENIAKSTAMIRAANDDMLIRLKQVGVLEEGYKVHDYFDEDLRTLLKEKSPNIKEAELDKTVEILRKKVGQDKIDALNIEEAKRLGAETKYDPRVRTDSANKIIRGLIAKPGQVGGGTRTSAASFKTREATFRKMNKVEINKLAKEGKLPGYEGTKFPDGYFIDDPFVATARTLAEQEKVIQKRLYAQRIVSHLGIPEEAAGRGLRPFMMPFKNPVDNKVYYLPESVHYKVMATMNDSQNFPAYIEKAMRPIQTASNLWKQTALFQFNYLFQNISDSFYKAFIKGAGVLDMAKAAWEIWKDGALAKGMKRSGVIGTGNYAGELFNIGETGIRRTKKDYIKQKSNPLQSSFFVWSLMRKFNDSIQDTLRASLYIDTINKGYSKVQAARVVRETFYDPADATKLVTFLRSGMISPFINEPINFLKYMLPYVAKRPRTIIMPDRLRMALNSINGFDPEEDRKLDLASPEYVQKLDKVWFRWDDDTHKKISYLNVGLSLSFINRFNPIDRESFAQNFGPFGKAIGMIVTGHDQVYGFKLDKKTLDMMVALERKNSVGKGGDYRLPFFDSVNNTLLASGYLDLLGDMNPSSPIVKRVLSEVLKDDMIRADIYNSTWNMSLASIFGVIPKPPTIDKGDVGMIEETPSTGWRAVFKAMSGGLIASNEVQVNLLKKLDRAEQAMRETSTEYDRYATRLIEAREFKGITEEQKLNHVDVLKNRLKSQGLEVRMLATLLRDVRRMQKDTKFYIPLVAAIEKRRRQNEITEQEAAQAFAEMLNKQDKSEADNESKGKYLGTDHVDSDEVDYENAAILEGNE